MTAEKHCTREKWCALVDGHRGDCCEPGPTLLHVALNYAEHLRREEAKHLRREEAK